MDVQVCAGLGTSLEHPYLKFPNILASNHASAGELEDFAFDLCGQLQQQALKIWWSSFEPMGFKKRAYTQHQTMPIIASV